MGVTKPGGGLRGGMENPSVVKQKDKIKKKKEEEEEEGQKESNENIGEEEEDEEPSENKDEARDMLGTSNEIGFVNINIYLFFFVLQLGRYTAKW
jgi:hypothetical protein